MMYNNDRELYSFGYNLAGVRRAKPTTARHTIFKWAKIRFSGIPLSEKGVIMKTTDKLSAFLARRDDHAREAREDVCNQLLSFRHFVQTGMDFSQQQINNLCARHDDYEYIAYGGVCIELVDLLRDILRVR